MVKANPSLVLASASPRRHELLALYGIPFEVMPALAEENASGSGMDRVAGIARDKCDEVFAQAEDCYVLAADTLVCVDDSVLGKPVDAEDAARMLRMLGGRWHEVHTGVCLRGPGGFADLRVETTRVRFTPLREDIILQYVRTGEPMDKAGAYAIQGISGIFVSRIEGSPSNVIGLPLALVSQMLENAGFAFSLPVEKGTN